MMLTMIMLCELTTFWIGVLSSVAGAIFGVFLLFIVFRPRIEIKSEIAFDEDGQLMFCFKNRSLFPCVNVHAAVKAVNEHDNDDETEYKIELEDNTSPYMSGRFSKEKDSEVGVVTRETRDKLPSHLRLIVTAQHSVSGIISVYTKDFESNDAKEGTFEKGLFVPKNCDYAQMYMRNHLKQIRIVSWICGFTILVLTALYWIFLAETWLKAIECYAFLLCFFGIILLCWQNYVQSRATAFSSRRMISRKVRLMIIELSKRIPKYPQNVEDVKADEENHGNEDEQQGGVAVAEQPNPNS